jgi:hypothetical protein
MRFVLGLIVGLAFPALALADEQTWRYAKWDMSPEEVVAASNGQASLVPYTRPLPDPVEKSKEVSQQSSIMSQKLEQFEGARSQLEQAGILFKVSFVFDRQSRKLTQVMLKLDNCTLDVDLIRYRLTKEYGKSMGRHRSSSTTVWQTNSETITYDILKKTSTSADCTIRYEPLPKL